MIFCLPHRIRQRGWRAPLSAMALLCLLPGQAAAAPPCPSPPCGNPQACDNALAVTELQAMSFGEVAVAGAGSVVLGTDSSRIGTGGAILIGTNASAGGFSVATGNLDCGAYPLVTVTVAAPATLTHTTTPTSTMTVNNFQVDPGPGGLFSAATVFSVGATLGINAGQLTGTYQGTYLLTISFQ